MNKELSLKISASIDASQLPDNWLLLPNRTLFRERTIRGNTNEELLSVSLIHGVTRQVDNTDRKDTSSADKSNYKLVMPGDLVYNKMRMWQGAVGASKYRGIVSPAYVVLEPRIDLNPSYFFYLYKTRFYINEFNRYSYGLCDDMNSLRYNDFRQIYSIYPPVDEQNRIVCFLDREIGKIDAILAILTQVHSWKSEDYCFEIMRAVATLFQDDYEKAMAKICEMEVGHTEVSTNCGVDRKPNNNLLGVAEELKKLFFEFRESLIHHAVMGNLNLNKRKKS